MKDKTTKAFLKCILEVAKLQYPEKRKRKYELKDYLVAFMKALKTVTKWEGLHNYNDNYKYHWKSIYNEFNKWSKDGIFNTAFDLFVKNNYFRLNRVRKNRRITMFVDATKINNLRGREGITMNNEYRKKNITPLTVICDEHKLPIAFATIKPNKVYNNGRQTSHHEITGVQGALDTIPFEIPSYVKIDILGDKGYLTRDTFRIKQRVVSIIAPKRKNQKIKNTNKELDKLKNRCKIEHAFATLKSNHRVYVRSDTKLQPYCSFVYLSMLEMYFNFIEKNKPHLLDKL
jgi:hypothetical protein